MTTVKYFSGEQEVSYYGPMANAKFAEKFPGVVGKRLDSFDKLVGIDPTTKEVRPITRRIFYKSNPSLHKCDARCRHAKGGNCECSCGGQFHGIGH